MVEVNEGKIVTGGGDEGDGESPLWRISHRSHALNELAGRHLRRCCGGGVDAGDTGSK